MLLRWLEPRELPVAVLLTKADKLSRGAAIAQERALAAELGPGVKLARFSALTGDGVGGSAGLDRRLARRGLK